MADEPQIKHAMAFIDGQNLYQHAKDAFGHHHPNYDPIKLHDAVCALHGWKPNLVRFYTGVPSALETPMWAGYWANRVLQMKRAGIHVTTRPLRYRKEEVAGGDGAKKIVTTPQEKGIDIRLALDVVSTARTKQWDVAVIFSQDQDLAEVVQEVRAIAKEQDRWLHICCPFPSGPNATSGRGIDKTTWCKMDQTFYDACIDSTDYRPRHAP
ncbi:NYN domain-containing protein [Nitratireductor sp. CAU 1489]|uniref:NYN domain-containing protein n=1 Tax=Nitratireductor arenosus TaxID=2682096 RepID=A0A844QQH1_9HYPH|nr:NYN domain-containing protein [Nitratireductor arenosus]MVB00184.1 NYN domain-containing protein [Nitratireductor arenosus]